MLRIVFTMINVVIMTTILGSIAIIAGIFNPYSRIINLLSIMWSRSILWGAGVRVRVRGLENLDRKRSYIYAANHQSMFDILAVMMTLPPPVRFIAKKELFSIPLFGWALSAVGMIKIDRSNRQEAIVSMNRALKTIKSGVSVIIFPEGTRSNDGLIHEFKKGGFVIAIKGEIPVVPVTIYGTHYILQKHSLKLKAGEVQMVIDKSIKTSKYTYQTRESLVKEVQDAVMTTFDNLKNAKR